MVRVPNLLDIYGVRKFLGAEEMVIMGVRITKSIQYLAFQKIFHESRNIYACNFSVEVNVYENNSVLVTVFGEHNCRRPLSNV